MHDLVILLTPDMQKSRPSFRAMCRLISREKVSIDVVFKNETTRVKPIIVVRKVSQSSTLSSSTHPIVGLTDSNNDNKEISKEARKTSSPIIENLASQDMASHAPAVLIPFLPQPVVA